MNGQFGVVFAELQNFFIISSIVVFWISFVNFVSAEPTNEAIDLDELSACLFVESLVDVEIIWNYL